jgi:hypothetical protein
VEKEAACVIAFRSAQTISQVLRQIDYLADDSCLTVIGHGDPDANWPNCVAWRSVPEETGAEQLAKLFRILLGRLFPVFYDVWFWKTRRNKLAFDYALSSGADTFHAYDWSALPIAVEAARRTGGRVVFHLLEYAELDRIDNPIWRFMVAPSIRYLVRKCAGQSQAPIEPALIDGNPIAARYLERLGLDQVVVLRSPKPANLGEWSAPTDTRQIRLIYHGYAKRNCRLHRLIEAIALTDQCFVLDLMLMDEDRGYIDELKTLGDRIAAGRIRFQDPVPAGQIVSAVSQYDVGLCVIEPSAYGKSVKLPSKLFEYTQAGLALVVGPWPAMIDLVHQYGMGVVAKSTEPEDLAAALSQLTLSRLSELRQAARQASVVLSADAALGGKDRLYLLPPDDRDVILGA